MLSSQNAVDEIKGRLSIVDVVSRYVQLKSSGSHLKGISPFSNEKTPSFFVSPDKNAYYCFSTSQGGDMFTFIEKMEGVEFKEALKILADMAGIELQDFSFNKKNKSKDRIIEILETAKNFFILSMNADIKEYLKKRGFKEETIKEFEIGYAKDSWNDLIGHLKEKDFKDTEIFNSGLSVLGKKGYYNRFRDRIMIPIKNDMGIVIGFSGRITENTVTSGGKYINTPETELYKKSYTLYGIDSAKNSIRKFNSSILVEGNIDVMLSHQKGYTNTVAICGTALTEYQAKLLKRYSNNVILCFDGDAAGIKALLRNVFIPVKLGMEVKVAKLEEGEDPADIISKDPDAWKKIIKESISVFGFISELAFDKENKVKVNMLRENILPLISLLPDSVSKELAIKEVSVAIGIPENAIREDLKNKKEKSNNAIIEKEKLNIDNMVFDAFAFIMDKKIVDKEIDNIVSVFKDKIDFQVIIIKI